MNPPLDIRARQVVFVVPDFEPTIGGTTRQTTNEARALLGRGYRALVLTQRIDRSWLGDECREGLRVVRITPSSRSGLAMKVVDAQVARWLHRHRREIAIVHVVMYPDFAVAAAAAGFGRRTVMVWAGVGDATDIAGHEAEETAVQRLMRAPLRSLRLRMLNRTGVTHVALTRAMAEEVAAALGSDVPAVIPTPVDIEAYRPPTPDERRRARAALALADGEVTVVFAGHLRASKRVDRLVDAIAVLRARDVRARLFVLGDSRAELDDCSEALRRQVAAGGLDDRVVFTGGVPDILPYLHAADVFVLPSEREGLSNALLEALACGVPCVAPVSAGGDQVLDSACGAVPESGDPEALAAAIAAVTDPARWPALSDGARQRARDYSIEAVTGQYERLYANVGVAGFDSRRQRRRRPRG